MYGTYNPARRDEIAYGKRAGGAVAKTLECGQSGVLCDATVRGETDDEVLRKAVEHAQKVHGVDLAQSKTLARYAQSLIRDEG